MTADHIVLAVLALAVLGFALMQTPRLMHRLLQGPVGPGGRRH
jgi:hypothetical protein